MHTITWVVCDPSALRSPELGSFLSASRSNRVLLTDYARWESAKGPAVTNLKRTLEHLSPYAPQLLILEATGALSRRIPFRRADREQCIDHEESRSFRNSIRVGASGRANANSLASWVRLANESESDVDALTDDFVDVVRDTAKSFDASILKCLRTHAPLSPSQFEQMESQILHLVMMVLRDGLNLEQPPTARDIRASYVFRYALGSYMLALDWIASGGIESAKPGRIRNDLVDTTYAACATLFDGLLTNDRDQLTRYRIIEWSVQHLFPGDDP